MAARLARFTGLTQFAVYLALGPSLLAAGGRLLLALYGAGFGAAYVPLRILGVGFLINAAAGPAVVILNMTGHHYVVTRISGISALGGVCLSLLLAMPVWNVWLALLVRKICASTPSRSAASGSRRTKAAK